MNDLVPFEKMQAQLEREARRARGGRAGHQLGLLADTVIEDEEGRWFCPRPPHNREPEDGVLGAP